MWGRGRIRPSRPISVVGMVVGIVFVLIGLFIVIPSAGVFGIIWTLFAVIGVVYNAANVFSEEGVPHEVVEFEGDLNSTKNEDSVESRLEELESLKRKGLINDREYQQQREKILKDL